jgi:hypothetical protein
LSFLILDMCVYMKEIQANYGHAQEEAQRDSSIRQPGGDREVTAAKLTRGTARYHSNDKMQALGWKLTP